MLHLYFNLLLTTNTEGPRNLSMTAMDKDLDFLHKISPPPPRHSNVVL